MSKYQHHSIALNEKDQAIYKKVNEKTGFGVTEIFRKMLYAIDKTITPDDETQGDGENKSKIAEDIRQGKQGEPTDIKTKSDIIIEEE